MATDPGTSGERPDGPLCPECGSPASQREPATIVHWLDRRVFLPRLAFLITVAAVLALMVWPIRPSVTMPVAGAYSLPLGDGVSVQELGDPPAGDAWTRAIVERFPGGREIGSNYSLTASVVAAGDHASRMEWVRRGWPITTIDHSIQQVGGDPVLMARSGISTDERRELAAASWQLATARPLLICWQRSAGALAEVYWFDPAMIVLGLLAADVVRRLMCAGLKRRKGSGPASWAAGGCVLALTAFAMLWPARRTESFIVWQPGVAGVDVGLTDADMVALVGRADADAVLASRLAEALADREEHEIVCVALEQRGIHTWTMRWLGANWLNPGFLSGVIYVTTGEYTLDGVPAPFVAQGARVSGGTGTTFIEFPRRSGALRATGVGFDHGAVAVLLALVWGVGVGGTNLSRWAAAVTARRRAQRGCCVVCTYPLRRALPPGEVAADPGAAPPPISPMQPPHA